MSKWTLFSNHGHVLVVLSRDPDARLRDVAQIVGITERAVQKIVRDLQNGGFVTVTKHGRRNRYRLRQNQPLRHTLEAHCTVGELLEMVNRHAPGLEPEEDAGEEIIAAETTIETVREPEPAPATIERAGVDASFTAVEPSASGDEPAPASPSDAEDEESEPPAPRRRKVRPMEDSGQGSLF
ncbi:MAG: winged helix-turn-helix domain-containing protein [Xanthomonadales bacterium]|jgi:hypothetical protein|nr:winged helix-turn-helix domain-containing protein [Xanthomonadales bacterium]